MAFEIGILGSRESATSRLIRDGHVACEPGDDPPSGFAIGRVWTVGLGECQQFEELTVVIKHLFKMRREPFGIGRITREATAEVVVDAAMRHAPQQEVKRRATSSYSGVSGGVVQGVLPEEAEDRRVGEFRRAAHPAARHIHQAREGRCGRSRR